MSEVKRFKLVSSALIDRILKDQCVSIAQLDQLSKASSAVPLHFVCTALPGPGNECVFVELETPDGSGSGLGEWITRPDGRVALVVPTNRELDAQRLRADTAEADALQFRESSAQMATDLLAAEQRIAELSDLLRYLKDDREYPDDFEQRYRAALNPKPEAGSHE